MKPGLYGIASLLGAPLRAEDCLALGVEAADAGNTGLAVRGYDPHPGAVGLHRTENAVVLLAGFLDEPEELAAVLGLPATSAPAALAGRSGGGG